MGERGEDRLTNPVNDKPTSYYSNAIRPNVGNAESMQKAVNATLQNLITPKLFRTQMAHYGEDNVRTCHQQCAPLLKSPVEGLQKSGKTSSLK